MMFPLKKLGILVALASASSMALAEEGVALGEMVVTGTRSETPLLDLAGNSAKVTEDEIDLINADHIQETLLRIPGMNLQRGNGAEMTVALRSPVLTGPGGGGAFLFLEDGIPLRSSGFGNNNGLSEAHYEMAGGIEVVRGPGSALYGSNAVHGLINVLTRAPSVEQEREIDFTAGSDDLYKMKGTVSDTVDEHAYRVSFSGTSDHGWRDDSGYDQQKITARHDYFSDAGDSYKTVLSAFNLNQNTAGFIKSSDEKAYEDSDLMKENHDDDAYRDWKSLRLSTRWDHELGNGNQLSLTPFIRSNDMEFRQHYLPSKAIEENEHDSIGLQASYYMDIAGGHTVIFGTDFEYTDGGLKETQERASYTFFGKNRQQGVHFDYDVEALTIAPYVHAEWQVAEKWRATTGLRFEHVGYDYENNVADGTGMADGSACFAGPATECLYNRPGDRDDTFNDWSPKLGLVYRVAEMHSMYANLSRGNRAPQTTDLYRLQNQQVVGEMDSEQLDNFELGFRGDVQRVNYEVSAFYMKKKNFFFRDSNGLNVTDGKTKHKGVEAMAMMPLGEQFDIGASWTYAEHEYDFDNVASGVKKGNEVDTAPNNISNIRLGWNFKTASRAELEWSHTGNYYLDPSNDHSYSGHDVVNLRVNTQVTNNLMLHGQIKNLTDEEYADRADYAFGDYRFFPGQERHFEVGASYNF